MCSLPAEVETEDGEGQQGGGTWGHIKSIVYFSIAFPHVPEGDFDGFPSDFFPFMSRGFEVKSTF